MNELIIKHLTLKQLASTPFLLENPLCLVYLSQILSNIETQENIGYNFPKKKIKGKIAANSELDALQEFYTKLDELHKIADGRSFCVLNCRTLLTKFFDLVNNLSVIDDEAFIEVLKQIIELLLQNENKFVKFTGLYIFAYCKKYGCSLLTKKEIEESIPMRMAFVELEVYLTQNPFTFTENQPQKLQTVFENYASLLDFDLIIKELSYCSELIAGVNLKVSAQYKKAETFIQAAMTDLLLEVKTLKTALLDISAKSLTIVYFITQLESYLKERVISDLQAVNPQDISYDKEALILTIQGINLAEILSEHEQEKLYQLFKNIPGQEQEIVQTIKQTIKLEDQEKELEKKLFKANLDLIFKLRPYIEKLITVCFIVSIGKNYQKSDTATSLQEISDEVARLVEIANKHEGKIMCYQEATMTFAAFLNKYSPSQLIKRNMKTHYS